MKKFFLFLMAFCSIIHISAQRQQQPLGRGVVAVANGSSVTVTWRRLAQEPEDAKYNVYVNGTKANAAPLSNTNWKTSTSVVPNNAEVAVSIVTKDGESAPSKAFRFKKFDVATMFMDINFEQGGSPLKSADFNTAYVWPVDLDGDGEMDYVVNRKSNSNGLDCYVEGYLSSGQHLWTVKLGPNELSCAGQDDQITAVDMDCDGLGDVVIQSSDGTQFWDPDKKTFGLYVNGKTTGDTDGDGIINYETQNSRNAPRYISVIDGLTGREKASVEQSYNQHYNRTNRASLMGDEYNKHVGHMGVFFFDGIHPGVVMEWHMRGTDGDHHYYNLGVAYDFSSGKAGKLRELFNEPTGGPAFHQIRVGDVDGDGKDEMIVGGYTMDNTGKVLFNTGIAHGDRFRTTDINPERPGLETFAIQQYAGDMLGQVLYDAGTGEFIKKWYLSAVGDIGRGECIDIDASHLGWEMWSTMNGSVYDAQGNLIPGLSNQYPCEGVWWDGELDREVVQTSDSHYDVYIQDFNKGREIEIAKASNYRYVTVYAKRAAFWGDIIGDWREELILLHKENGVIVGICGFSTDYTTSVNNIYCLLQDPHYQGDCTTKGYYQSPNPGFYLGYDMPRPQLPPVMVTDLIYSPSATAWNAGAFTNYDRSGSAAYSDGKSVLFDLTSGSSVNLPSDVKPSVVYAMPVKGQAITISGNGSMAGEMDFWKGQQGRFTVNTPMNYTGKTYITEGILEVNNHIKGDVELRARGTLAGNATLDGSLVLEGALHYEGGRLMPGTPSEANDQSIGTITFNKGLIVDKRLFAEMDIVEEGSQSDLIDVKGNLNIAKGKLIFTIIADKEKPAPAKYKLMSFSGILEGTLDNVSVRGLQGISYNIVEEDKSIYLIINEQRSAAQGVRWTGAQSNKWAYQVENFQIDGEATEFVAEDAIGIGDDAQSASIQMDELMPVSQLTFDNDSKTITISGLGGFSGNGDLVKNGAGRVNLATANSNYTGKTIINEGTLAVSELADGGLPSSIGAASSSADNFQIGKATLLVNNANTATNRGITLTDTATIQIPNGVTALKGQIRGASGVLRKSGSGQLNITYPGANSWKATILQGGTLAMGEWNTTFGTATSPILVSGNSTITVFDNNSTRAVPTLKNVITIDKNRTLTINGGQRCKIQGQLKGEGTLKINFPYVRGDFETNLSQFEGTLNPTSGQFRISTSLDLSKGTFTPGKDVYVAHVTSQGADEQKLTSKFGSLTSTETGCQLSTGTYNVGYLGKNDTYAGTANANATINKYGEGKLTLTGASACPINIYEGEVIADNATATTTGLINVKNGGTLRGTGAVQSVTVEDGGTLAAGKSDIITNTLTIKGALRVNNGGRIVVKASSSSSDAFKAQGLITLNSPVFIMQKTLNAEWNEDKVFTVFTGGGKLTLTGTPTFEPAVPMEGYLWDISRLADEGVIAIVANPTAISHINLEEADNLTIFDLSGRRLPQTSTKNLTKGVYIINGQKVQIR